MALARGAGEQPVMTDAVEPLWQNVQQESADELVGGQRHDLLPVGAAAAIRCCQSKANCSPHDAVPSLRMAA